MTEILQQLETKRNDPIPNVKGSILQEYLKTNLKLYMYIPKDLSKFQFLFEKNLISNFFSGKGYRKERDRNSSSTGGYRL
jgi:hypothetical protein